MVKQFGGSDDLQPSLGRGRDSYKQENRFPNKVCGETHGKELAFSLREIAVLRK